MYGIEFNLPLVGKCKVEVNEHKNAEYIKRQLLNYFINSYHTEKKIQYHAALSFDDIDIVERFTEYRDENIALFRNGVWSGDILMIGDYKYCIADQSLQIKTVKKYGVKQKIKRSYKRVFARTEEQKYALAGETFYRTVLFPILSVYAACYGLYCIHGSLIHLQTGENIILSGLDGVGKSTLSNMVCEEDKNRILADNIVMFDGVSALNFNLAMRLEIHIPTKQKVLYQNKEIKEVLPQETSYGLCKVAHIYNLLRGNDSAIIHVYERKVSTLNWVLFMEMAPEIGQANSVLSYWLFMYGLMNENKNMNIPIVSLAIPRGKLELAKEIVEK